MFINGELPKDEKYPLSCVYWIHTPDMTDPKTQGYVGVSNAGSNKRFSQHLLSAKNGSSLVVHKAIRKYDNITIKVLVEAAPEFCLMVEECFRPTENIAWNLSRGGLNYSLGAKRSMTSREKMSASAKGKVLAESTKEKLRLANTGKKRSEETKRKLSLANRNRQPISEITRQRMSESRKDIVISEDTREKYRQNMLGNTRAAGLQHSDETKALMSKNSSKWRSPVSGAVWEHCLSLWERFINNSYSVSALQVEYGIKKKPFVNMREHFRNGWNPNEDQEYLSWLEEKKGIE